MRDKALAALDRAQAEPNGVRRSLWLAKTADYAIKDRAVLVGGAAVNLHTGSYRPTDIDMCAYLDESDRRALVQLGFSHAQDDHFSFEFADGEVWLLEFPATRVDGDVSSVSLSAHDKLDLIRLESLVVDRFLQATDGTGVTFDEALRLVVAVYDDVDWEWIDGEVQRRSELEPGLGLNDTYLRVTGQARELLKGLD